MSFFRNSTCTRTQYGVFSNQHIPTHHGLIYCTLFNTYLHLLYTFVIKNLFRQWGSLKPVTKLPWKSSNHKYNRFILSTMLFVLWNSHIIIIICVLIYMLSEMQTSLYKLYRNCRIKEIQWFLTWILHQVSI